MERLSGCKIMGRGRYIDQDKRHFNTTHAQVDR